MPTASTKVRCQLCHTSQPPSRLAAAACIAPDLVPRVREWYPNWRPAQGACPGCVRLAFQRIIAERALEPPVEHNGPGHWAAWECLPTPFRVAADGRFTGLGVTIAMVDTAFFPHPDLTRPVNRIRAWVDVTGTRPRSRRFRPDEEPRWTGWDKGAAAQWHGQMSSCIAAGNGKLSQGFYRGMASDADVILVHTFDGRNRVTNETLVKALRWLIRHGPEFDLRVVSFSVAGDPVEKTSRAINELCARLVEEQDVVIVAAAGNSGRAALVAPASSPEVITVGGLDDRDRLDPAVWRLWNSNFGRTVAGNPKPDLVAPSWRVVAPVLPKSSVAEEARGLFHRRLLGDLTVESRINDQKLVTPDYQHMDGTSTAAPIVAGTAACMLQANPDLTATRVRQISLASCRPVPDADPARQGAGAVDAGRAVALALEGRFGGERAATEDRRKKDRSRLR